DEGSAVSADATRAGDANRNCRFLAPLGMTIPEEGARRSSKLETRNSKLLFHRRDALWQIERATRAAGPLLDGRDDEGVFASEREGIASPLARMTDEERLVADFRGTGLTVGPHAMQYRRAGAAPRRALRGR